MLETILINYSNIRKEKEEREKLGMSEEEYKYWNKWMKEKDDMWLAINFKSL